jgi:capsular polysaccharide biosynthesis protein
MFRDAINSGQLKFALFYPSQSQLDYLELIGINPAGILAITEPLVRFRTAIMTSGLHAMPTHVPGQLMCEMFGVLRENVFKRKWRCPNNLRVFFLRGEKRRIENEDEAASIFAEFGFLCVRADTISLPLQATLVANSSVLASTFGSSLSLAPAMQAEGTVIEILPADIVDPWMVRLLTVTQRRHVALLVGHGRPVIDTERLREALEAILG